jgi:hypothetical protein
MRFKRRPRAPYIVTDRKRSAATRAQLRQRQTLPLLAEIIAERQPPIVQVMEDRAVRFAQLEQRWRDDRAHDWRRARRRLDAIDAPTRGILLCYWNEHRWLPGDPTNLLDALHRFATGRLVIKDGTLQPARLTIAAGEAFAVQATRKPIARGWLSRRR